MNKRFFVILGVLLVSILIISLVVINARKPKDGVLEISQCNENASELCVVTFGLDDQDNMVINFQLSKADYPLFYVKISNRESVNTYSCEVVTAEPTSVFCRGMRTPLGEYIDMEVYAVNGDTLIAQGRFLISSLMRIQPIGTTGTLVVPTGIVTGTASPTPSSTPLPGTAYPNPTTPIPGTAYPNP